MHLKEFKEFVQYIYRYFYFFKFCSNVRKRKHSSRVVNDIERRG